MTWSIYIDESGNFTPDDPSFVVGLLFEGTASERDAARTRASLERLWRPVPYPPHAALLAIPASRILFVARRATVTPAPAGTFEGALKEPCRALARALEATPFGPRLEEIRSGARPTWEDAHLAEALVRRHPAYVDISGTCDHQHDAMGRLVAEVFSRLGAGRVTVVAIRADTAPAGPCPTGLEVRRDAYVRALEELLRRTAVLSLPGAVEVHALTRDVDVGVLGRAPLQAPFLVPILRDVERQMGVEGLLHAVPGVLRYRDVPRDVAEPHGEAVHPLLVLADWTAWRLRRAARGFNDGYDRLVDKLVRVGILPTHACAWRAPPDSDRRLPTLGANEPTDGARWVREQAAAWARIQGRCP